MKEVEEAWSNAKAVLKDARKSDTFKVKWEEVEKTEWTYLKKHLRVLLGEAE